MLLGFYGGVLTKARSIINPTFSPSLSGGWGWCGAETSKLLIKAWSFWWPACIPPRVTSSGQKMLPAFLSLRKWQGALCQDPGAENGIYSLFSHSKLFNFLCLSFLGFPGDSVGKESSCNAGDTGDVGSILGLGRSLGERHGIPLQSSCLENPMDRGAWWATVHRVTKSQTGLKQLSTHAHTHAGLSFHAPVNDLFRTLPGTFWDSHPSVKFVATGTDLTTMHQASNTALGAHRCLINISGMKEECWGLMLIHAYWELMLHPFACSGRTVLGENILLFGVLCFSRAEHWCSKPPRVWPLPLWSVSLIYELELSSQWAVQVHFPPC